MCNHAYMVHTLYIYEGYLMGQGNQLRLYSSHKQCLALNWLVHIESHFLKVLYDVQRLSYSI